MARLSKSPCLGTKYSQFFTDCMIYGSQQKLNGRRNLPAISEKVVHCMGGPFCQDLLCVIGKMDYNLCSQTRQHPSFRINCQVSPRQPAICHAWLVPNLDTFKFPRNLGDISVLHRAIQSFAPVSKPPIREVTGYRGSHATRLPSTGRESFRSRM
jgi:hypothetical protein